MKKIHTPNHKLYEQYYLDQAKQKGGNLPAFHGARFQRGYGLGSITKANGDDLDPNTQVGPVNLFLHSMFSQVDVSLNERLITPSTNTYPYCAMIETLLNYGETLKQQQKSVLNKLWTYLPRILHSLVLVKKVQKGKYNQEKTVCLQARNRKNLPSKRNPKINFPS